MSQASPTFNGLVAGEGCSQLAGSPHFQGTSAAQRGEKMFLLFFLQPCCCSAEDVGAFLGIPFQEKKKTLVGRENCCQLAEEGSEDVAIYGEARQQRLQDAEPLRWNKQWRSVYFTALVPICRVAGPPPLKRPKTFGPAEGFKG